SPRFSNGSSTYSLLSSHVFIGDGRSGTVRLAAVQTRPAATNPTQASSRLVNRSRISSLRLRLGLCQVVHGERSRVLFRILSVEHRVPERDLLGVGDLRLDPDLLHGLEVDV